MATYEVREYINGATDWYSHSFEDPDAAAAWVMERAVDLPYGADIVFPGGMTRGRPGLCYPLVGV